MNVAKKNKKLSKKIIILVLAAILAILTYVLVAKYNQWPPFVADAMQTHEPGTEIINMDRTKTEEDATKNLQENPDDKLKNEQVDQPSHPDINTSTGKQSVNVLITNAGVLNGQVSASGFVTNIAENDGSCEYIFEKGSTRVTMKTTTLVNATSTTCKTTTFSASELGERGEWTVILKYTSSTSEGTSKAKDFAY